MFRSGLLPRMTSNVNSLKSSEMALSKTKNIEGINNLKEMLATMEALGISDEGLEELNQMKARVREELSKSTIKPDWTACQAFSVFSQAKDEDERKRNGLLKFFSDSEHCLSGLDERFIQLLQLYKDIGCIKEKMKFHQEKLKREKEYFVLVAGETGSGKSSLVNLILGEELLPYSLLSTTSTICELKYGEKRRVVAHFKEKDPEKGLPTKTFSLVEPSEGSSQQSYLQQISPYVHVKSHREEGSIYKKIELFWPHELLKRGVVIIDSPGIGESVIMDNIVTQYLPQAFAFIYVINSVNAGGVQKDKVFYFKTIKATPPNLATFPKIFQEYLYHVVTNFDISMLEKLLSEVSEVTFEGQEKSISSKCALFVCNKWDQVPEKEREEVKNHVIMKLKRFLPGLIPESQIIYMSTTNATTAQIYGVIGEEFYALMNGIKSMSLKSSEAKLDVHWKWLYCLLWRVIYQAEAFLKTASRSRQEAFEKLGKILARLVLIEKHEDLVMADLVHHMETHIKLAIQSLSEYLKSDDVRRRFTSWTLDEVPEVGRSWEETKTNIRKALEDRMREIVDHWEEDNQVIANTRESILHHFQQQYNFLEGQLRNLEGAVTSDGLDSAEFNVTNDGLSTAGKVVIGITSPIWIPITLVALVIATPVAGIMAIKDKLEGNRMLKKFENDKCAIMIGISTEYLDSASSQNVIEPFMKKQLKGAALCLKHIKSRIPELVKADKMLFEQLSEESRSQDEIKELYQPIVHQASDIVGHLGLFGIKEIHAVDIRSEELEWKEDISSRLGSGAFATVYQGKMRRRGAEQTVALKVCNEVVNVENAGLLINEVDLLRKLDHPHIVKFYGTSLIQKTDTVRMILVMEKCKGTLKSHIFDYPESVPAKASNPAAEREAFRWVKEITAALAFIHETGIVHRDLKLENILLSDGNIVKVTDVGVSKEAKDITGTLVGTPVYMAPEVFHSEIYDSRADIYSFGLIMWEMWYGQQAFDKLKGETLAAFFSLVDKGYRPGDVEGRRKPPPYWKVLMEKCWNGISEERPSAKNCYQKITELYAQVVPVK